MHKKLEAELVSLAHSILQMKNKDDVEALHDKAHQIYEKLSVLKFVEEYISTTPTATQSKEEIIEKIDDVLVEAEEDVAPIFDEEQEDEVLSPKAIDETDEINVETEDLSPPEERNLMDESPLAEIEEEEFVETEAIEPKDDVKEPSEAPSTLFSLEEEFKDAISSDVATQLFEKATKENPVVKPVVAEAPQKQKSLNDALFTNNLQVGLNDRIAFVKHLFDGSQEDFNRVWSQLNSFKTEKEAKNFIVKIVKPDYDWSEKEEFEQRLIELIERKFM